MPDMESLDRAVEEARERVINEMIHYADTGIVVGAAFFHAALDDFEAAVSAKARAEERERYERALIEMLITLFPFSGGMSRPAKVEDGKRALAKAEDIMQRMIPDYERQREISRALWDEELARLEAAHGEGDRARSSEEAGNGI